MTLALMLMLAADPAYVRSEEQWRRDREASLKAPDGWLAVAGLFWLNEGENRIPEIAAFGSFRLSNGQVWITSAGKTRTLEPDRDLITQGTRTIFVIKRGKRLGIRLRDTDSETRRNFTGLHWYPVREAYRVTAKFVASPRKITVPNILGESNEESSPGFVTFRLNGQEHRLHPVLEGNRLFFIFKDTTSAKTTYGAGRFLYTDAPRNGEVILDFNRAYNPPCAFTAFATCPLPPPENRLRVPIEAGELNYGHH